MEGIRPAQMTPFLLGRETLKRKCRSGLRLAKRELSTFV